MEQAAIDRLRIERAAGRLWKYARSKDLDAVASVDAAIIMSYLREESIAGSELKSLIGLLNERNADMERWLIRQARGVTTWQKEYRAWLLANGYAPARMFDFFGGLEVADIAAFTAGFVFGVGKSLTYDNVVGLYEMLGLAKQVGDVFQLFQQYETDLVLKLVDDYRRQFDSSLNQSLDAVSRFSRSVTDSLASGGQSPRYGILPALGELIEENRQIVIHLLSDPVNLFLKKIDDDAFVVFDYFYQKIDKLVDDEQLTSKVWDFIKNSLYQKIVDKANEKLADYRFFEAGAIAGNGFADSAQLLAGLILLAWQAGKLLAKNGKLLEPYLVKLGGSQRATFLAFVLGISAIPDSRVVSLHAKYLPTLIFGNSEARRIEEAVVRLSTAEQSFVKAGSIEAMQVDAVKQMAGQANAPLPAGCSAAPGDAVALLGLLNVLLVLRRRKNGTAQETGTELVNDAANQVEKNRIERDPSVLVSDPPFAAESFLKELAEEAGIKDFRQQGSEEIVTQFASAAAKEFEQMAMSGAVQFKPAGLFAKFNAFVSKKLRDMLSLLKNQKRIQLMVIVDEKLSVGFRRILKDEALITFNKKTVRLKDVYEMSILDFYDDFFPEKKLSDLYGQYINLLKNKAPLLHQRREALLKKIFAETDKAKREMLFGEYEQLTESLNKAIQTHGLEIKDSKVKSLLFGKLELEGRCGNARPDLLIADFEDTRMVFDFIHLAEDASMNPRHLTGTEFYQDFMTVILGKGLPEKTLTKDIPYTFSAPFLELQKREKNLSL